MQILQFQQQAMTQGGANIVVDLNGVHRAVLDWAKSVDLEDATKYFLDPESPESQQAQQAASAKEKEQFDAQIGAVTAEAQAAVIGTEADKAIDQQKIALEYFKAILDSENVDAKIIGDAVAKAQQAASQGSPENTGNGADTGAAES